MSVLAQSSHQSFFLTLFLIGLYSHHPVPFEGRLERHEAGGGVRWPRQGAKRTPAAEAQAAMIRLTGRGSPAEDNKLAAPARASVLRGCRRASHSHRARDAGWSGGLAVTSACVLFSTRTQGRGFGEPRHPARPRPFRAAPLRRRCARAAKNRAGGALACLVCRPRESGDPYSADSR